MFMLVFFVIIIYVVYFIILFGLKVNYFVNVGFYVIIFELLYCLYLLFVGIFLLKDECYLSFMFRSFRDYVVLLVLILMYFGFIGVLFGEVYGDYMSLFVLFVEFNIGERKVIIDLVVREIVMVKMGICLEYGRGFGVI